MPLTTRYGYADIPLVFAGDPSQGFTTLAGSMSAIATTGTLTDPSTFPGSVQFDVIIGVRGADGTWTNVERALATGLSGSTITLTRPNPVSHAAGERISNDLTAAGMRDNPGACTDSGDTQYLGADGHMARFAAPSNGQYAVTWASGVPSWSVIDLSGYVPTSRTVNGHALSGNISVTAGDLGLGLVENTALSTWVGSTNLTTLGTVVTGAWNGTAITVAKGGTGSAFFTVAGPTVTRTYTFPDASSTVVTTAATQALSNKTGLISQWTNDSGYLTSVSVPGSDTQVIFNDAGVFGGSSGLVYAKATQALTAKRFWVDDVAIQSGFFRVNGLLGSGSALGTYAANGVDNASLQFVQDGTNGVESIWNTVDGSGGAYTFIAGNDPQTPGFYFALPSHDPILWLKTDGTVLVSGAIFVGTGQTTFDPTGTGYYSVISATDGVAPASQVVVAPGTFAAGFDSYSFGSGTFTSPGATLDGDLLWEASGVGRTTGSGWATSSYLYFIADGDAGAGGVKSEMYVSLSDGITLAPRFTLNSSGQGVFTGSVTATDFILAGSALKTDTLDGHTGLIQAYDVDGGAYKTFGTLTNGNTPSFDLSAPSGGTLSGNFTTLQVAGVSVLVSGGALGMPASGTLTNATGLLAGGLTLTDTTTNNVSATAHGFAPKFPNNTTTFLRGDGTYAVPPGTGAGTVTSVGLSLPAIFTVSGSPVTTTGTLTAALATQVTKTFLAGPTSGADAVPTFRVIAAADVPTLNQDTTGGAAKWTAARNLAGNSVDGSANVAFANKFVVQGTVDAGLSAAQFLGALGTGIVKNTTTTGVLSIAIAADFPTLNQNTSGNAATVTTNANLTGPITSSGNATSIAAQTGTGTTFAMSASPTFTGTVTIPTPFTLGAVSVTATGTQLNYLTSATGTTGTTSTNLVFSTSPTFITPTLGAASATSISFGTSLLINDASNVLSQRNGANQQTFNLYGTYTDGSNYQRFRLQRGSTNVAIVAEAAGTGLGNCDITFSPSGSGAGAGQVFFNTNNSTSISFAFGTPSSAPSDACISTSLNAGGYGRIFQRQLTTNNIYIGDIDASNGAVIFRTNGNDVITLSTAKKATFAGAVLLAAGTATAATAPLKFTSGTNLTTAEAGAMEYNGTNLFFTRAGTVRENVLVAIDNVAAPSTAVGVGIVNFYGAAATNFLGDPNRWLSVNVLGSVYKIPLYT